MRRVAVLFLSMVALAGAFLTGAGATASTHRIARTSITIVRPVTASGHASPAYTIRSEPRFPVDCRYASASLPAVSPDVEWCSPTALYPVACWRAAAAHKALCVQDPRRHEVVRFPRVGPFARTAMAPIRQRAPLSISLGDGDYCTFRAGGAWNSLPGHPHLVGYYACRHDGAVWAHFGAAHYGVDESQPTWTVRTAQFDSGHIVSRRVVHAWFVGTHVG